MNAWMHPWTPIALALMLASPSFAQLEGPITQYLVVPKVGEYTKAPLHRDPIDAAIASGEWKPPVVDETVEAADGSTPAWAALSTASDGEIKDRKYAGGYAFASVTSPDERVVLLKATRHASVRVNGSLLAGDPYGYGFVTLPVLLRAGANELLFHIARPGMRAELVAPDGESQLAIADSIVPDVVRGSERDHWASIVLINSSREPFVGGQLIATVGDGSPKTRKLPRIEPLSAQPVAFQFKPPAAVDGTSLELKVTLAKPAEVEPADLPEGEVSAGSTSDAEPSDQEAANQQLETLATATLPLRVVEPGTTAVHTFRSGVDGSVQRYACTPADKPATEAQTGTILTLHPFGVDCEDHIARYAAKSWAHIVAPQGRRRYGFDWEDWSAIDAIEALDDAQSRYACNRRRTYLTGVGVGGHGAWLLGAKQPDRFAAVGPTNAWLSYWSYGGGMPTPDDPTPVESMLSRAALPSDTLAVLRNLASTSVYLLHDVKDRLVSQSRFARRRLGDFHTDFVYFERGGAPREQLTPDWEGMMRFFRTRETPTRAAVSRVDFATADPGQSANRHWARIEAQEEPLTLSRVQLQHDLAKRTFTGTTTNVARLSLDVSHLPEGEGATVSIRLDDSAKITTPRPTPGRGETAARVWLAKDNEGRWRRTPRPRGALKTAGRHGGFKNLFANNALLVYGTAGDDEENAWARVKALYDAQTFWVRGGGALEVLPDTAFNPLSAPNRNVILYGNADTNRAWPALLSTSPVQVRGGQAYVGVRPEEGDGIGVLMVRPRRNSRAAMVGVVGGTSIAGMRLTNRLRYFFSGVAYPDLLLIGDRAAIEGAPGVRATGFFGPDWTLEKGQIVWRDLAL